MSHDAKLGSGVRHDRALRTLAAAHRREAAASHLFAELADAGAAASVERAEALAAASVASAALSLTFEDTLEAARTLRLSELLQRQSVSAQVEAGTGRTRANLSRAQARRALAQAATNEGFRVLRPPAGRGGRRGG